MDRNIWEALVLGGGVAGLSAAQMLGRARRRTLVIDSGAPRNRFAAHMHGVLGHDGVNPADLLERGRAEAAGYDVVIEEGTVVAVHDEGEVLRVVRADGTEDRARAVVVASGVRDELPDIAGLADHWGSHVLHCPYCHGWEVRDRHLAVIATSPASAHQMELVRQWSDRATAFTALAEPLGDDIVARMTARGIEVVREPVVEVVTAGGGITGIRTADGAVHPADAVFTAPAARVLDGFLADLPLVRGEGGGIAADARGATSHPRIWAAGNVVMPFANVPLSMGMGSMAGAGANAALVAEDATRALAAMAVV
jgi:thioredoxin reductase